MSQYQSHPEPEPDDPGAAERVYRLLTSALGVSETPASREAVDAALRLPEDDTRDELVAAHLVHTLRLVDATHTLWRELLTALGVVPLSEPQALLLLLTGETPPGADEAEWCGAVSALAGQLDAAAELLSDDLVRAVLAPASVDVQREAMAAAAALSQLEDTPDPVVLRYQFTAHLREDHPDTWRRLVATVAEPLGQARVAQWRAAASELTRSGDGLLRHLNRRAEGGYPASDEEVQLLSGALGLAVDRDGAGFVTVEADSCPWRDERGRVVHPLGLEREGT